MIFVGSVLKNFYFIKLFNIKYYILINCSRKDLFECICIGGNCYIYINIWKKFVDFLKVE